MRKSRKRDRYVLIFAPVATLIITPKYLTFSRRVSSINQYLTISFLLFTVNLANAQDQRLSVGSERLGIRQLHVGDCVPDYVWEAVLPTVGNGPDGSEISLRQFKDRPLILLDFWSTYCAPCIAMIPKIQAIEKYHKREFVAVPITSEANSKIKAFMARREDLNFWSVVEDKVLEKAFPRESVPHEVWIKDGKVFAITDSYHVNDSTVSGIIDGSIASLPEKTFNSQFNDELPFLIDGNGGGAADIIYHSALSGYIDGIVGARKGLLDDQRYRISMMNASPVQLFKYLASIHDVKLGQHNRSRFDGVSLDSLAKLTRANLSHRKHLYSFEIILPKQMQSDAVNLAFSELNNFFSLRYGFFASIVREPSICWILRPLSKKSSMPRVVGEMPVSVQHAKGKSYKDISISTLVRLLNAKFKETTFPIIDETASEAKIDFQIGAGEGGFEVVKEKLADIGLELILDEREMEMLVFNSVTK